MTVMPRQNISVAEYWHWLQEFADMLTWRVEQLENFAKKFPEDLKGRDCGAARIAERSFNYFIDSFLMIMEAEGGSFFDNLGKEVRDRAKAVQAWNDLKNRRDALADRIAKLIGQNEKTAKEYNEFCEHLKDQRRLGFML